MMNITPTRTFTVNKDFDGLVSQIQREQIKDEEMDDRRNIFNKTKSHNDSSID